MVLVKDVPLSPCPKVRGLNNVFLGAVMTERSLALVSSVTSAFNGSSGWWKEVKGKRHVERSSSVISCGFVLVFTTQLYITVVNCHVSRNLHVAPGAFGVLVRITALVAVQRDLGDELLVTTQGHCLW